MNNEMNNNMMNNQNNQPNNYVNNNLNTSPVNDVNNNQQPPMQSNNLNGNKKNSIGKIVGIVLAVIVVLFLATKIFGGDKSTNGGSTNNASSGEGANGNEYHLGDKIKIGDKSYIKVTNPQKVTWKNTTDYYEFNIDITNKGNYRFDARLFDSNYDNTKKYDTCSLGTDSAASGSTYVSQPVSDGSYFISCPKINNQDATLLFVQVCTSDFKDCSDYFIGE